MQFQTAEAGDVRAHDLARAYQILLKSGKSS